MERRSGLSAIAGHWAVQDECTFLGFLLNCRADCATARFKALDGIGKAVRQRLKSVLHIDLPVLSASYSKTSAFAVNISGPDMMVLVQKSNQSLINKP